MIKLKFYYQYPRVLNRLRPGTLGGTSAAAAPSGCFDFRYQPPFASVRPNSVRTRGSAYVLNVML